MFAGTAWEAKFASKPRHPVVRLDMSTVTGSTVEEVGLRLRLHLAEQCLLWFGRGFDPCTSMEWLVDPRLYPYSTEQLMCDLLASLQQQVADPVVLVDEYDTPLLKLLGRDPAEVEPFLGLFREFYRLFKQCESDLHKVLIAGITRRGYGEMFSNLNNLRDCTWKAELGAVCGFTEGDLDQVPLSTCDGRGPWRHAVPAPGTQATGTDIAGSCSAVPIPVQCDTDTPHRPLLGGEASVARKTVVSG